MQEISLNAADVKDARLSAHCITKEKSGRKLHGSESSCFSLSVEIPHLCAQCNDYPCIPACPVKALSVDEDTTAVLVDKEKCTGCGQCIKACPGNIPFLHPSDNKAVICDLCGGDPECVKICQEAKFDALILIRQRREEAKNDVNRRLFAQTPEEFTKDVAINLFGEKAEELI